ncbi:MAG: pyridoxal phosphate-dependent aminotransferase [Acidobacteria bacterium]|nr:pyridoxal phosphate-dependent aminotransferase [Acidobacteriota bacterium]
MSISRMASALAESPTLKLNARAKQLKDKGEPIIHLGAGEPKSKVPPDAVRAATEHLATGEVRYTASGGTPELKRAVVGYTERWYGRKVEPANVLISGGAKQALSNALTTLVNPGDEVIILAPYWVSYPEMVRMVYANPVIVPPTEGRFYPDAADVENAVTGATKAILLNSPNNPSGAVHPPEFIEALVDLCERKGVYLIMDDIYHQLIFDGAAFVPAWRYARQGVEDGRIIVVNGVSKLYAMTGFRIGWTVAPKALVKIMDNVQSQTTSCPSALSQTAALGALTGSQDCVTALRTDLEANRDIIVRELRKIPGINVTPPGGTFYCFPDFRAVCPDSMKLGEFLLDKVKVVTVPGKEFGLEGFIRLSYCGSARDVVEGVARIRWAVDPDAPPETEIGGHRFVRDWDPAGLRG